MGTRGFPPGQWQCWQQQSGQALRGFLQQRVVLALPLPLETRISSEGSACLQSWCSQLLGAVNIYSGCMYASLPLY